MARINEKRARHLRLLVNLAGFLANHPEIRTETVCDVFGLSRRKLLSALDELLMWGVPPYGPSDYITAWVEADRVTVANADFLRRPLSLTVPEAVSLKVMIEDFIRQSPGVFAEAATSLGKKIDSLLGHGGAGAQPPRESRKAALLRRALEESRTIEIAYYSRMKDALTVRVVEPAAIIDVDGLWYLAGFCRFRNARRIFRMDRIKEARLLDESFQMREDFDVSRYVHAEKWFMPENAPRVEITFGSGTARWARERFGDSVVRKNPDGSLVCELPLTDPTWLADILAEFEGDAVARGVERFRRMFRRRLKAVLDMYD